MLMNFCGFCSVFGQFISLVHFSLFFPQSFGLIRAFHILWISFVLCVCQKNFLLICHSSLNLMMIDFHCKCVLFLGGQRSGFSLMASGSLFCFALSSPKSYSSTKIFFSLDCNIIVWIVWVPVFVFLFFYFFYI